jgi:hypothetical protein
MKNVAQRLQFVILIMALLTIPACSAQPGASTKPPYYYDEPAGSETQDAAIAEYRAISQWDKTDLSYAFTDGTPDLPGDEEDQIVAQAFGLWAAQTPLTFTEITNTSSADIVISWVRGGQAEAEPFDGPGGVLAHASFPNPYDERQVILEFDEDEDWVNSNTQDVDLLTVATHEIGHTLGLDHSPDPDAIMYASYSGPHRFLSDDDIAGIHAIYGVASAPNPAPQAPPVDVTPPPSQGQDSDADGISDQDEIRQTGTDPNKADSDGDGLGDGVEVYYHMNPLDPDMDKDGVNDGTEVQNGTDPFFPDQATGGPTQLDQEVSDFLSEAINREIQAYREGDATVAAGVMAGQTYADLQAQIDALNQRGEVELAEFDYYQSYIDDIREISSDQLEVDTCEVWSFEVYRSSDEALVDSDGPRLLPQTITIRKLDSGWFITSVEFFDPPAFCR